MPDPMYPEADAAPAADQAPAAKPAPDEKPEKAGGETTLIPKSLLGGKPFKVGDEVVLKIVHDYEDEVEVEYAQEDEKPMGEREPDDLAGAQDQLGAMAT